MTDREREVPADRRSRPGLTLHSWAGLYLMGRKKLTRMLADAAHCAAHGIEAVDLGDGRPRWRIEPRERMKEAYAAYPDRHKSGRRTPKPVPAAPPPKPPPRPVGTWRCNVCGLGVLTQPFCLACALARRPAEDCRPCRDPRGDTPRSTSSGYDKTPSSASLWADQVVGSDQAADLPPEGWKERLAEVRAAKIARGEIASANPLGFESEHNAPRETRCGSTSS